MKFVETCELCKGIGYLPIDGKPKPFPKGDWVECPQCDTKRNMVSFEQRITPRKIFLGTGLKS